MKVKNVSGSVLRCQFLPTGYAEVDEVVDVPDSQADGSPLTWSPDFWEPQTTDQPAALTAGEAN